MHGAAGLALPPSGFPRVAVGLSSGPAVTLALAGLVLTAAALDVRSRRIPNWLTVSGLGIGLALAVLMGGWPEMRNALGGAAVALAAGLALFAFGVLGAGDAKLVTAVGAFFGLDRVLGVMLIIAVFGGVLAALHAARKGIILPVFHTTGRMLRHFLRLGDPADPKPEPVSGSLGEVPYGLAIAAGTLVWWFWGVPLP